MSAAASGESNSEARERSFHGKKFALLCRSNTGFGPDNMSSRPLSINLKLEYTKLRLRVFENRVLRGIFGPKRDEVIGGWRKLHNEELHNLYCSPSIIRIINSRRMRLAWHVARMGENRNAYRILVGKPEGKRPPGRPRSRWEDNIRMDVRVIGWGGMDLIDLAQDRDQWRALVNTVMNLRVP
jgi:hypothetical protein